MASDSHWTSAPEGSARSAEAGQNTEAGVDADQNESEWADIGRRIERQLRREIAQRVGVEQAQDWSGLREALLERVKGQAEELDKSEIGRRLEEAGKHLEERVRGGLGQAVGAGPEADWAAIGRVLRERAENVLDPVSPGKAEAERKAEGETERKREGEN